MSVKLPDGFFKVPSDKKATITFDIPYNRFYFSTSLRKEFGISKGDRIGLAYNPRDRQLCVDLNGRAFKVNAQGYVTSAYFAERSYGSSISNIESPLKYVRNEDFSDLEEHGLIFFDEV